LYSCSFVQFIQNSIAEKYFLTSSGVFTGGGTVRCPPFLARSWKFFTSDFIWKGAFFAVFQQISEKNGRICGFYWTFKSSVSASGVLRAL